MEEYQKDPENQKKRYSVEQFWFFVLRMWLGLFEELWVYMLKVYNGYNQEEKCMVDKMEKEGLTEYNKWEIMED